MEMIKLIIIYVITFTTLNFALILNFQLLLLHSQICLAYKHIFEVKTSVYTH